MIDRLAEAAGKNVSRETVNLLVRYADLLIAENQAQNLISRASVGDVWERHIVDSAQLLRLAPTEARWLDIGSGPGLPGIVLAILGVRQITLCETRRLRTAFLERCVAGLALQNVTIITGRAEQLSGRFDVITARAVAPLDKLFALGARLMLPTGHWVLPKGRSAANELAEARATWQGTFRLEGSLTDPDSRILVATGVQRKAGRG